MLRRNFLGAVPALCLAPVILPKILWNVFQPDIFQDYKRPNKLGLILTSIQVDFIQGYGNRPIFEHTYVNKNGDELKFAAEEYLKAEDVEKQKRVLEEQWEYDDNYEYYHLHFTHWEMIGSMDGFTRIIKNKIYSC